MNDFIERKKKALDDVQKAYRKLEECLVELPAEWREEFVKMIRNKTDIPIEAVTTEGELAEVKP